MADSAGGRQRLRMAPQEVNRERNERDNERDMD
jgi:hypothetical protein